MARVSPEALERVARLYHTNVEAAAALGMTMRGFGRACRVQGIETPYVRKRRMRCSPGTRPGEALRPE